MAVPFRKAPEPPAARPRAIVASAVNITERGVSAWRSRKRDDQWQKAVWYHFDICGELRYALTWVANAVSMASMYAAEVDPQSGLVTGPTENTRVQEIANGILGGPAQRAQAQSTLALNWQAVGEVWTLIQPMRNAPDKWTVLSTQEIREQGGSFSYEDPITGTWAEINPSRDMLIRTWSPHPAKRACADSAVRAALPTLQEIEKTSQNISARLDSRLWAAGMMIFKGDVDFPQRNDGQPGLIGFMDEVIEQASASLSNPGQASAQVPIMMQIPSENGSAEYIDFSTELSSEIIDLRSSAVKRLGLALDMPAEIMLGMGESNHWNAWQIEESAYKIHVAPLLDRIADAYTTEYFYAALRADGIPNPERYVLAFDVTEVISRPNRFDELDKLHEKFLISDDYMRAEAGIPDEAIPSDEERSRRFFQQIVATAPTIIQNHPEIAEAIGLDVAEAAQEVATPAIESAPASSSEPTETRSIPDRQTPDVEDVVQASAGVPLNHLVVAAELVVYDALSRAGGRLLTRSYRGQFQHMPKPELHTAIPVDSSAEGLARLLEGSFQFSDKVADGFGIDRSQFSSCIRSYCEGLLTKKAPHDRAELRESLWQMIR